MSICTLLRNELVCSLAGRIGALEPASVPTWVSESETITTSTIPCWVVLSKKARLTISTWTDIAIALNQYTVLTWPPVSLARWCERAVLASGTAMKNEG